MQYVKCALSIDSDIYQRAKKEEDILNHFKIDQYISGFKASKKNIFGFHNKTRNMYKDYKNRSGNLRDILFLIPTKVKKNFKENVIFIVVLLLLLSIIISYLIYDDNQMLYNYQLFYTNVRIYVFVTFVTAEFLLLKYFYRYIITAVLLSRHFEMHEMQKITLNIARKNFKKSSLFEIQSVF